MMDAEQKEILDRFFYPRSLAVIGVSADENAFGTRYLSAILKFGFKGKLYPIHPRGGELLGIKVYPRLGDVPDAIDLAVVCLPGRMVSGVLEECLAKGIQAAIVVSAGFSETGEEGKKLELELAKVRAKGIRIMGPNCFGVYCPRSGLTLLVGPNFPRESGPIGLVAQSGQFAEMIVLMARGLGLRFSKVISYGNAFDLNEADYLEYLAEDPDTKVIAVYVEGAKQGRRFLEVVRRTSKVKPVIVWKGGLTSTGSRAAGSHTGSLAGSAAMWDTFFAQSGAIRADSLDDLIDATIAFAHSSARCSRRVALLSGSGGTAVIGADACERAGLELPSFSPEVQKTISSLLPPIGTGVRNPVDLATPHPPARALTTILETIFSREPVDTIILGRMFLTVKGPTLVLGTPKSFEQGREEIRDIPLKVKDAFGKSIYVTLSEEVSDEDMVEFEADRRSLRRYYITNGIPVYPTLERAVKALAHVVRYQEKFHPRDGG
jgi:acyl-CoA synthetase (NDP forming)